MLRLLSRTILPFAAVLSVTSAILAFGGPRTPAPDAGRAIMHGDQLLLAQSQTVCEMETRPRTVMVNGKVEEQTYAVACPRTVQGMRQVIAGNFRVMTVAGERLTGEQAAEKLKAETNVLVSATGKLLDPAYQTLYPPETLIVYLRPEPPCLPAFGLEGTIVMAPAAAPEAPPPPVESSPPPPAPPAFEGPPPPKFPELPLPKGPPPVIGLAVNPVFDGQTTANDKVRLSVTDWRTVFEQNPVEIEITDAEGVSHKVVKSQVVTHWLGQGRWTDVPLADLALIDRQGVRLPAAARTKLTGGMIPVLLMVPGVEIDSAHFKHFRPETLIIQAELPAAEGQAFPNMLPPHETLAKIVGDKLTVFKPIFETKVKQVPVAVIVEGKEVTQYKEEVVIATKSVGIDYALADVKASDSSGKALDAAALARRLAVPGPVLTWENGWPIGEIYLAPLKPDTLNLVLPPWSPPAAATPRAAPPPTPPAPELPATGLPPRFALAQHFGNVLVLREPQHMTAQFPKTVSKTVDGKVINETVYESRVVTHWHEHAVSAANCRLADCSGQPLDEALAFGRLNKETMVLISDQGKKVDPVWLAIYKPEAVVVYLHPQMYGGYAAPAPAPVAPSPGPTVAPGATVLP